jgi:hypothetical protein
MNEIWWSLGLTVGIPIPALLSSDAAQAAQAIAAPTEPASPQAWFGFLQSLTSQLGPVLINLAGAVAILLLGWLIAAAVSAAIRGLLRRTNFDNHLLGLVSGQPTNEGTLSAEKLASAIVFWIIMILAIVAALNVLNLTTVSQPLNNFLNQIFAFLPKLGAAAILTGIAWVVATLAKTVVTRTAQSFSLDERLFVGTEPNTPGSPFLLSETLGNALYWFIFLFFLPLILGVLELQGPLQPVQNLLNDVLAALPRILKAIAIGVVGWFIARTVRGIVTNLLAATGTDQLGNQFGLSRSRGGQSLSWIVGTIVYVLILIPTATAALDALGIPAISGPATSMLNQILNALPQIFTSALILVGAYIIGKFVADLVSNILAGIGFNNVFSWRGIPTPPATASSPAPMLGDPEPEASQTFIQEAGTPIAGPKSPSEIIGVIVLIGILLFATVAATNILNLPGLTLIVTGLLVVFGRILSGLVVFAVGLYLANLAHSLITSPGGYQARILGQAARIAIIALVTAMALQQIGVAPNIVNLAFGLLLGAVAVAIAIAFGLGGREVAAEQLRDWLYTFKRR